MHDRTKVEHLKIDSFTSIDIVCSCVSHLSMCGEEMRNKIGKRGSLCWVEMRKKVDWGEKHECMRVGGFYSGDASNQFSKKGGLCSWPAFIGYT